MKRFVIYCLIFCMIAVLGNAKGNKYVGLGDKVYVSFNVSENKYR